MPSPSAPLPLRILALLGLLAAAPRAAAPKSVTLADTPEPLTLSLNFDSLAPGGKQLEYSGDYIAKKEPFRIFAQERYHLQAGEFKGWAEDHYLEKRTAEDQPGSPHLEEYLFEANLYNGQGDTLFLATGSLTPWWETGQEIYRAYKLKDGSRREGSVPITSMDDLEREFPDLPTPVSLRTPGESRRKILTSSRAFDLAPPPYATRLEVFNLSGKKVHSDKVRPGAPSRLPSTLRDQGVVYVKFLN